jgi:hypothetical protein
LFTGDGESPHIQTSEQDRSSAERESLENVGASADAAIEENRDTAVYFPDDGGERIKSGDGAVHLPAAVVRDDQSFHTRIERAGRIRRMQDAFQNDGQTRVLAQERNVAPGERGVGKEAE